MVREEKKMAAEMDELFLQMTEILWEHVADSYTLSRISPLHLGEHYIIEFLAKESFASMSQLSRMMHVAPTTTTSIVDRLVKCGYLQRHRAKQDRRKVLVALSEKGKQFVEQHRHQSMEMVARFLSTLPDKGKNFYHSLNEIKRNLEKLKAYLHSSSHV